MKDMKIKVSDYIQDNHIKIIRNSESIEILPQDIHNSEIKKVEFLSLNEKQETSTESSPYRFSINSKTKLWQLRFYFEQLNKSPLEFQFSMDELTDSWYLGAKFNPSQNEWSDIKLDFSNK